MPCCVSVATQVIRLDPSNAHAYHNRGISYEKVSSLGTC